MADAKQKRTVWDSQAHEHVLIGICRVVVPEFTKAQWDAIMEYIHGKGLDLNESALRYGEFLFTY